MAELVVGDIVARLRSDLSQFTQGLAEAQRQLAQFAQATGQIRQAQASAQQSTSGLVDAYGRLVRSTGEQVQAAERVQQATQRVREQHRQLTSTLTDATAAATRWRTAIDVAAGIGLATTLGGIVSTLRNLVTGLVQTGLQFEQLRASISAISGSTTAGAAQFQFLIETSTKLGYSITTLAEGFRQISGATRGTVLAGAETQKIFEAVATASRAMGASQQQLERALLAIGQVISKGTVQMEELRGQLAEAIPGAVQIAARAFGVTTEELNKMVAAGNVGAIPFIRALTRQMQYEFAPAAAQAAQTTGAAFARLGTEIKLAAEAIANSGILQALRTISDAATSVLKNIREAVQSRQNVQGIFQQEGLLGTGLRTEQVPREQLERLGTIRRRISELQQDIQAGGPMAPFRQEQIERLQMEQQQLIESVSALQRKKEAQAAVTAETNKQVTTQERVNAALEQGQKLMEEFRRIQERMTQQAQVLPNVLGSPTGTEQQRVRFLKEQEQELEKVAQKLAEVRNQIPQGAAIPPELATIFTEVNQRYGQVNSQLEQAQKTLTATGTAAKQNASDLDQARVKAAQYAAELAKIQAFIGTETPGTPEAAEAQARAQGEAIRASIVRVQEAFRQHPQFAKEAGAETVAAFDTAFAQVQAAIERHVTQAGDTVRTKLQGIASDIQSTIGRAEAFIGAAGEGSATRARLRVEQQGIELTEALISAQQRLQAEPAVAQRFPDLGVQLEAMLAGLPAATDAAAVQAAEAITTRIRGSIRQLSDDLEQIQDKLSVAGADPLTRAIAKIRQEYADLDSKIAASITALERLRPTADTAEQARIDALIAGFRELATQIGAATDAAVTARQRLGGEELLTTMQGRLEGARRGQQPLEALFQMESPRRLEEELAKARPKGMQADQEAQIRLVQRQIYEQEQLNMLTRGLGDISRGVTDVLVGGLTQAIVQAQNLGQAFEAMGKKILDTVAQIALDTGFRMLISLGFTLLGGAIMGGAGAGVSGGGAIGGGIPFGSGSGGGAIGGSASFQHGGVVRRPTMAMIGEAGPEAVVNRGQMAALMDFARSAGPSAGGQAAGGQQGVSVILVDNRAAADMAAAREKGLGRQVIIQSVLDELSAGSSSRISRAMRMTQ